MYQNYTARRILRSGPPTSAKCAIGIARRRCQEPASPLQEHVRQGPDEPSMKSDVIDPTKLKGSLCRRFLNGNPPEDSQGYPTHHMVASIALSPLASSISSSTGCTSSFSDIRVGVVVVSSAHILAVQHHAGRKAHTQTGACSSTSICGLSIVLMVHLTGGYASGYYAGINLVLLGFIFILPVDTERTLLSASSYTRPILSRSR